ncbi:hypothetical protein [Nocardia sp. AG03]|uniref:hypothetical protein n=1 Tax=Nocardia sp. AG03 TaxID=3025312 RepID=UPI00241845E4|nr:hypothetical protein [Nocardia sp. AG03]
MSDDRSIENALSTPDTAITALAQQVATARGKIGLQHDTALYEALSDSEIRAERELAEWVRAQRRKQRRRVVADELATDRRDRRTGALIRRADEADARWHRKALAARRRVSSADARLAQLYRRSEWSSRALIGVVVLGMVWAGVNVQRNLVPSGDMSDPLYWLSYGIEAMISIPIIVIMITATTAARWGRELERGKVLLFELALLGTTVALNAGPHLAAGSFGRAAEYAIAPVMVGVVIWLHAWVSARYALLIEAASVGLPGEVPAYVPAERVMSSDAAVSEFGVGSTEQVAPVEMPVDVTSAEITELPDTSDSDTESASDAPDTDMRTEQPVAQRKQSARRVAVSTAPSTLELIHKAAADHRRNGTDQTVRIPAPTTRRIPVAAAAQTPAGDATGTDPVPEATAHADTVARDPNGDTPAPTESVVVHNDPQPPADEPEQLTLTPDLAATTSTTATKRHPAQPTAATSPTAADMLPSAEETPAVDMVSTADGTPTVSKVPTADSTPTVSEVPTADTTSKADKTPTANGAPTADQASTTPTNDQPPTTPESPADQHPEPEPTPDNLHAVDEPLTDTPDFDDQDLPHDFDDDTEVRALARQIAHRNPLRLTIDQIEEILELTDQSWSAPSIGAEVGVPGTTVTNIVDFARKIRQPYAYTG